MTSMDRATFNNLLGADAAVWASMTGWSVETILDKWWKFHQEGREQ